MFKPSFHMPHLPKALNFRSIKPGNGCMRLAILSREPNSYSTKRLVEAAELRGHEIRVIDTLRCYMNIATHKPSVYYQGVELPKFDAVIPRIGSSITFYGTAVLRQFEMMGVHLLNESLAISRSRDKLRSLQLLSREGVGLPATWFAHAADDIPDIFKMMAEGPLVAKLLEGTQGRGVMLIENKKSAASMMEAFMDLQVNILIQEFIEEAKGADIRCLVIGGKVVAAMKRQAKDGDFRSNLHRGGEAKTAQLSADESKTAIRACRVLGLNVAGVDILRSKYGPVVIEVNSSPGLEGIEKATGMDVAAEIIGFMEKSARTNRQCATGRG